MELHKEAIIIQCCATRERSATFPRKYSRFTALSNFAEPATADLNIFEPVTNGAPKYPLYLYSPVYLLDIYMWTIYNRRSKLSDKRSACKFYSRVSCFRARYYIRAGEFRAMKYAKKELIPTVLTCFISRDVYST